MSAVGRPAGIPRHPTFAAPAATGGISLVAPLPAENGNGKGHGNGNGNGARVAPDRLALTRRAPKVMQRHALRSAIRVSVLMAGDAAALLALRFLLRGVRDLGWLGPTASTVANTLLPPGALPLVQLLPAVLLGLVVVDTYGASDRRRDAARLLAGTTLGLALPYWSYLWQDFSIYAVPGFILAVAAIGGSLILERHAIDRVVRELWPIGPGAARAVLVGTGGDVNRALEHPALSDRREFAVIATFDPSALSNGGLSVGVSRLCQTIKRYKADTLVLSGTLVDEAFAAVNDAAGAAGCQVVALTRSFSLGGVEPQLVWRRGAPLVVLNRPSLRGRQLILKRTLDLVCSSIGLILLAPLLGLIALAVRLSSPGPILFRQTRVGLGGGTFQIAKFRSMVCDAEARRDGLLSQSLYPDPRLFKLTRDPRVTRLGAFLRRTSLDELPQLWNVLKGEMSLVGPRPPLPSEVELYEEHHYTRFDVKPGITGPWQVKGRNLITDFDEVIRLETSYIREWTVWKDLGILLRTIPIVVLMRGAH